MKLIDILAAELKTWPEDCDELFQTSSGRIIGVSDTDEDLTEKLGTFTLNDEGTDPHVRKEEWFTARQAK